MKPTFDITPLSLDLDFEKVGFIRWKERGK